MAKIARSSHSTKRERSNQNQDRIDACGEETSGSCTESSKPSVSKRNKSMPTEEHSSSQDKSEERQKGKMGLNELAETKEFFKFLKELKPISVKWERSLKILQEASKQHCIDYLIYLGGLQPILSLLESTKELRIIIILLDFLLKSVRGHHIHEEKDLARRVRNSVKKYIEHPREVVQIAARSIRGTLASTCGLDIDEKELTELDNKCNGNSPAIEISTMPAVYGAEICGRWAYYRLDDQADSALVQLLNADRKAWTFCRVQRSGGKGKHSVKFFKFDSQNSKFQTRDGSIDFEYDLIVSPSKFRFLTDKEGQDVMRRKGLASGGRHVQRKKYRSGDMRTGVVSQAKAKSLKSLAQKGREDKAPIVPKALPRDTFFRSTEVTLPKISSTSGKKTEKERLDELDQAVVRMRLQQWQAAQVPLRRRRRSVVRRPHPLFLSRTLRTTPCIQTFSPVDVGENNDYHFVSKRRTDGAGSLAVTTTLKHKLSQYPGVQYSNAEGAWRASTLEGSTHSHLGYFESEEEAWRAIYTLREARKWPVNGPPPQPLPTGEVVPPAENPENDQRSQYPGVIWTASRARWTAETSYRGICVKLGCFLSDISAWRAICTKRRHLRWPAKSHAVRIKDSRTNPKAVTKNNTKSTESSVDTEGASKIINKSKQNSLSTQFAAITGEGKEPDSPVLAPGVKKYVSWNMFQKINRGRQVTSREWRAYNLDLARRSESADESSFTVTAPTPNSDVSLESSDISSQSASLSAAARKRKQAIEADANFAKELQKSMPPRRSKRPRPSSDENNTQRRVRRWDTSGNEQKPSGKSQKVLENPKKTLSVHDLYEALTEFNEHFCNPASAVVWLMTATPTKFRRLLVPPRYRFPPSYQGSGGYASAFERLQLTVTEADKGGSRWHRWYAAPHINLENVQKALRKRWDENASKRQMTTMEDVKVNIDTVAEESKPSDKKVLRPLKPNTRATQKLDSVPGEKRPRNEQGMRLATRKRKVSNNGKIPRTPGKSSVTSEDDPRNDAAKTVDPKQLTAIQGKWLSKYQGVRTDPTVTEDAVIFRNGSKFELQAVDGHLTIDGIWKIDIETSNETTCVWRNMGDPKADPVVWTRKEAATANKLKLQNERLLEKPEVQTEGKIESTKKKDTYSKIIVETSVSTQDIPKRETVEVDLEASKALIVEVNVKTDPARKNSVPVNILSTPRQKVENGDDVVAVARVLAGFHDETPDKLSPRDEADELELSDYLQDGEAAAVVLEIKEHKMGEVMKVHTDDFHLQSPSGMQSSLSQMDTSSGENSSSEDREEDSLLLASLSENYDVKTSNILPNTNAQAYKCFGCGSRILVIDGHETVECSVCGNTSMSYRYRQCASALEKITEYAGRFNNSGNGFRGYNRHGHVEWVGKR